MNIVKSNDNGSTKIVENKGVTYITFKNIEDTGCVLHGFSTRLGGVSEPPYDTMNFSFSKGDDHGRVVENLQTFFRGIGDGLYPSRLHKTDAHHQHPHSRNRGYGKGSSEREGLYGCGRFDNQ